MVKSQWITCIIFLLLLPMLTQAQSGNSPAQLQKQLRQTGQDTNRVKLLLALGSNYLYRPGEFKGDLDSAFLYFQEAKSLSAAIGSQKWIEETNWLLSAYYFEAKNAQAGKNVCLAIIDNCRKSGDKLKEADAWMRMGEFHNNDSTNALLIHFFEQASLCYQQIHYKEKEIEARKQIGDIYLNQGRLEESETQLLEVLEMYKAIGFRNLHYTYDLLAAVSSLRGNLNRALFYGLEMIKSMEATGDSASAGTFYYRLARIYRDMGKTEQGVEWFKKSFAKSQASNYGICSNIIRSLIQLGRTDEALTLIQTTIQKSPPRLPWDRAQAATALANCYNALGQYDLAEKYYLVMIRDEHSFGGNNYYTSTVNFTIGEFYVNRYRYREAEPYLKKVLATPTGIVTPQRLKDTHLLLFKIDSAAGNYLAAIRHFQQHKLLNDSIFNDTKGKQIEELQIQYETARKEKDITLLQNESALQQSRLQQANLAKNITFGGGVLMLIIMALLYNRYRLKQRSNRQLELQQTEINQTNRSLQNLVQEKELLLREIHHRVKNNLQIVMSLLNTQSVYLNDGAALTAIRDSQQRIHSISLIHQKLYQSNTITQIDMPVYIRELADYLQDSYHAENAVDVDLQIAPIELDVSQAVPIGLILNEAISNAIKYAFSDKKGSTITIAMQKLEADQIHLTIADNGKGLPPDFDPRKSRSLGMSLMRGLSKQLHGSFAWRNNAGLVIDIVFVHEKLVKS